METFTRGASEEWSPPGVNTAAETSDHRHSGWRRAGLFVALAVAGTGLVGCASMGPAVGPTASLSQPEAEPVPAQESRAREAGRRLRETGQHIHQTVREGPIADDFREAGQEIGTSFREAGSQIQHDAREFKQTMDETEWVQDAKEAGREIGRQGKALGLDVKDAAVDFWHGLTGK